MNLFKSQFSIASWNVLVRILRLPQRKEEQNIVCATNCSSLSCKTLLLLVMFSGVNFTKPFASNYLIYLEYESFKKYHFKTFISFLANENKISQYERNITINWYNFDRVCTYEFIKDVLLSFFELIALRAICYTILNIFYVLCGIFCGLQELELFVTSIPKNSNRFCWTDCCLSFHEIVGG